MSQPGFESGASDSRSLVSGRIVHDLRAPLIVALGYLDELRIFKLRLLDHLSSDTNSRDPATGAAQLAEEVDEEMSLCINMIKDSLDELDTRLMDLKERF